MLRFEMKLPPRMATILEHAIDYVTEEIGDYIDDADMATITEDLADILPNAYRVFTPEAAIKTLKDLKSHIWDKELYYLNDYHYLLLYDTFEEFAVSHNDTIKSIDDPDDLREAARMGKYIVKRVDFDAFLDYFWDLDFLTDPDVMLLMPEQVRKMVAFNEETFGLTQGLQPHPDELTLITYEEYLKRRDDQKKADAALPAASSVDIAMGPDFWASIEKTAVRSCKNIEIEKAKRMAAELGVDLVVFNSFDAAVHTKILALYSSRGEIIPTRELAELDSNFIPSKTGTPVIWMKTLFPATLNTALFFFAVAPALLQKYYPGDSAGDVYSDLITKVTGKYPMFTAERFFKAILWSYAYLYACHVDLDNKTCYSKEAAGYIGLEGLQRHDTLLTSLSELYMNPEIDMIIRAGMARPMTSGRDIFRFHHERVEPMLEKYADGEGQI